MMGVLLRAVRQRLRGKMFGKFSDKERAGSALVTLGGLDSKINRLKRQTRMVFLGMSYEFLSMTFPPDAFFIERRFMIRITSRSAIEREVLSKQMKVL